MQTRTRLVIIGNGMVGHKVMETPMASAAVHRFELITFCEDPATPMIESIFPSSLTARPRRICRSWPRGSIYGTA